MNRAGLFDDEYEMKPTTGMAAIQTPRSPWQRLYTQTSFGL
jgi:hypothetical protein